MAIRKSRQEDLLPTLDADVAVHHVTCNRDCQNIPEFDGSLAENTAKFLSIFASRKSRQSQQQLLGSWTAIIREMLSKGYSYEQTWEACRQLHEDGGHVPFHALNSAWPNLRALSSGSPHGTPNESDLLPRDVDIEHLLNPTFVAEVEEANRLYDEAQIIRRRVIAQMLADREKKE